MKPQVEPIGIGDLKVVKQNLLRYEAGEIAHIENVLRGEKRERRHRRLTQYEVVTETEALTEEESRRDLQSTERFELRNEIEHTLNTESSLEAGLNLSAGYGPVNLSVYGRAASSESKQEAERATSQYTKEVIDKSTNRLLRRSREQRRVRTLDEAEETNLHSLNGGRTNLAGIYRWVDKVYRAKAVNYGRRLMYEFVVPEPGAWYLHQNARHLAATALPTRPAEPGVLNGSFEWEPLTPGAVRRDNYLALVAQTGAEGVKPPPPDSVVLSKAYSSQNAQAAAVAAADALAIPRGYLARSAFVVANGLGEIATAKGKIIIGSSVFDLRTGTGTPVTAWHQVAQIAVSSWTSAMYAWSMNIEVYCTLSPEAFQQWQLDTYSAIMAAYRQALSEYEDRLAAAQVQAGVTVRGRNPALNRTIERDELKRAGLTLWTADWPGVLPGIGAGADGVPVYQRANAIGNAATIAFFEDAFEWTNMVYTLYPYFWGRSSQWPNFLDVDTGDSAFDAFLTAGAARVVVPVRPSQTARVLWYQLTGTVWPDGSPPDLSTTSDPRIVQYNSYLQDMADVTDLDPLDEQVDIDPHDPAAVRIRLPTTLVHLQSSEELPTLRD
ncbi:hypothetical protein SAMN04489712_10673 [Thermomonospora echinospora]|uniref:Uncharacterized protein n=1 Tax=Thermomonospora echinospora TaxID=1992 RepID=A0A1H6AWY5_9ACTN|nr:hypothetical protein [Thermomonospora echinospora]SEG53108.1 hypothetical protein SAMN04489712_10673 [Thermomonospora echinospora]